MMSRLRSKTSANTPRFSSPYGGMNFIAAIQRGAINFKGLSQELGRTKLAKHLAGQYLYSGTRAFFVFCDNSKRLLSADLTEKKRLAPLNEGGPVQLLNIQIQKLEEENQDLRIMLKTVS